MGADEGNDDELTHHGQALSNLDSFGDGPSDDVRPPPPSTPHLAFRYVLRLPRVSLLGSSRRGGGGEGEMAMDN